MKAIISRWLLLGLLSGAAFAQQGESAWISDELQTSVSDAPQSSGKYLGSLKAGVPVQILRNSEDGRYVLVQTGELQGWVWAKNIMHSPSVHSQFAEQRRQLNLAQAQHAQLKQVHDAELLSVQELQQALAQSRQQAETARADLLALQRVSANAVEIDRRNRELQARVVSLEQENLQLQHQNSRLQDTGLRRQMLLGGGLVLSGAFLSVIFSLLGRTKRRRQLHDL